jgi:hypothetical protein
MSPDTSAPDRRLSTEALRLAQLALSTHPECLWMRHPDAPLETPDDVGLIVRRLRQYGSVKAWQLAGALERCL